MTICRMLLGLWLSIAVTSTLADAQDAPSDKSRKSIFDFDEEEMDQTKPAQEKSPSHKPTPTEPASPEPTPNTQPDRSRSSPRESQPIEKLPVPSAAEIDAARKLVLETYPALNSAVVQERHQAMSEARARARDTANPPAERYALFDVARDIAEKNGQSAWISVTISEMDRYFQIDSLALQAAAIKRMGRTTDTMGAVTLCLLTADRAVMGLRPVELKQALEPVNPLLAKMPKEMADRYRQRKQALDRIVPYVTTLQQQPNDPAANFAIGWYHVMARRNWVAGLPLLAKGTDHPIKKVAQRELSLPPDDIGAQMELANEWWEFGEGKSLSVAERASAQWHASRWYRRALPTLQGLQKTLADNRIKQARNANASVMARDAVPSKKK